jgi:hypothetical protein
VQLKFVQSYDFPFYFKDMKKDQSLD